MGADLRSAGFKPFDRLLDFAMLGRGGSDHERTVFEGFREGGEDSRRPQNMSTPTAETASWKATSYGLTTRKSSNPKLAMARAAAPMFRGLRVEMRTTQRSGNDVLMVAQVVLKSGTWKG